MTEFDPTRFAQPEPLPAEFDREQRAVDALLSTSARMQIAATPMGLAQRVFDASIAHAGASALDPLPAEFEGDLHTIDSMLTMSASASDGAPAGLSQRVYEASVAHLPGVASESTSPLRLVGAGAPSASSAGVSLRWSIWQRLSLAASVAIVGGIALWAIMQQPPAPQPVAHHGPNTDSSTRLAAEISNQFNTLNNLTDDLSDYENEVAYLLDATQVLSVADLNHDFDAVATRIDM